MLTDDLIQTLGYANSPHFLRPGAFGRAPEHAHVFRRAAETCGVRGVYLLRRTLESATEASAPAVYVAEASSGDEADKIHRRVWNQNVVPFLVVRTPSDVRLYSGFEYRPASDSTSEQRGVLEASVAFGDVLERLGDLRAESIDDGTVWQNLGRRVDPATRVDWRLLEHLKQLGDSLRSGCEKLSRPVAHALIGKFVYLRYLSDRDILSQRKLERLGIDPDAALSRNATVEGVRGLVEAVDGWLNGTIFPFPFTGRDAPKAEHLRTVASVFLGDDLESGQLHLDFRAYDFSFIPVETLSVIYEQFLSAEATNRENGAYYTPIHLVNFMLSELDGMRMIEPGTTVLDPSCGSGAFLVQCYRRIVERHLAAGGKRRASDLRELLVSSIYGVDRDEDACRVSALSLTLAMLDYIDPPDLESTPQFKLPNLIGENIFVGDFFQADADWVDRRYDLVVGNPPWIQAGRDEQSPARSWMIKHANTHPVTNNDIAEAFAWKAMEHVSPEGAVGLLLPAMTLFKDSTAFRARYFTDVDVAVVANFTNLRELLFRGTARLPAAAIFAWGARAVDAACDEPVIVFSPLVANQELNGTRPGKRKSLWSISVNNNEVQQISRDRIRDGDMLPWKVAMWGGPRDMHLLRSMRQLPTLDAFLKEHELIISAGLELREEPKTRKDEAVDPLPNVAGMAELNVNILKSLGRIYALPPECLKETVPSTRAFARKGRAQIPFSVCHAPHIVVSGARTFATFSDQPFVIPPRRIGIGGSPHQTALLKALALYLNSDFVVYYETFKSPQGGVREGRSTLGALKGLPVPLDSLTPSVIGAWATLYDELADTQRKVWTAKDNKHTLLHAVDIAPLKQRIADLEAEANEAVARALGLKEDERVLVRDFVHVRRRLADGLVPDEAVGQPTTNELEAYASRLGKTLNRAIPSTETRRHDVRIVTDRGSGMVGIELSLAHSGGTGRVFDAADEVGRAFAKIRQRMTRERGQWLYFDRNLFLFDGPKTFLLKPMQRLWWTEAQALADADHLVALALAPMEGS